MKNYVARVVGYASPTSFHAAFGKKFGINPGDYLKRCWKFAEKVRLQEDALININFIWGKILDNNCRLRRTLLYRLNAVYETGRNFRDFDQGVYRFFVSPVVTWKISDRST